MAAPKGTRPPAAGRGRPRGAKNKLTCDVKEMILAALNDAGGEQYLVEQAHKNPTAFMALLGKVLSMQVAGSESAPIHLNIVNYDVDTGVPR